MTVFVSIHSAISIFNLEVRREVVSPSSSHPIETVWLLERGRKTSDLGCMTFGFETNGLGEPSDV